MKPCPFCGSKETVVEREYGLFYVRCDDCGASASYTETHEEAVEAWNERSPDLMNKIQDKAAWLAHTIDIAKDGVAWLDIKQQPLYMLPDHIREARAAISAVLSRLETLMEAIDA